MNRLVIYFSGFTILFISCSPRPVFRLAPETQQTTFDRGMEYIHLEENGVRLTISYYRHFSDQFVMDVEISNETDSVLRVDPIQFSYDAFENIKERVPDTSANILASRRAINPEEKLLKTDIKISQEEAEQRTDDLFFILGQTASAAGSIIADTPEEREELRENRHENYVEHEIDKQRRELEKENLRDQRAIWELDALRKTDLFPGEYIRGYIFFENAPDAKGYTIRFDNEKAAFDLFYYQWKYEAD